MRTNKKTASLLASASALLTALGATPVQAQILTLGDVINALLMLDATVSLQGQAIGTLQTAATQQLTINATVQANTAALQGTVTALDGQVATVAANLAAQGTSLAQLQADVSAGSLLDAAQSTQIGQLAADVTSGVANDALQDAALASVDVRLGLNDATDAVQGTNIAALQGGLVSVNAANLLQDASITTIDARLILNDAVDAVQGTDIAALQGGLASVSATNVLQDAAIGSLDARLVLNEATDVLQGADIAALQGGLAANVAVDLAQDGAISGLTSGLLANTLRDDGQDLRLAYHDVLFADHDVRITLAQSSADDAQASVALLRSDVNTGRAGLIRVDGTGNLAVGGGVGGTVVSFVGSAGDRRLTGIADGTAANDAATVGQMTRGDAATLAMANAYTDASLADMTGDIDRLFATLTARDADLRSELDAAAAGAAALAGMPQAFVPGQGMVAMAVGGRGSEVAVAVGVGKAFAGPHTPVIRAGAAIDSKRGQVTYNAGVGLHF